MKKEISKEVAIAGKLLSHPARIRIIELLSKNECCVPADFFSDLPLSRGSINQHLTALKEASWINTSLNGSQIQYCLNKGKVQNGFESLLKIKKIVDSGATISCSPVEKSKSILFLCTGNSCRSQMAEAFFNHFAKNTEWSAYSAGTAPAKEIHPLAKQVMKERDISIADKHPKEIKEFLGKKKITLVVFVCSRAEKNCPYIFPFATKNIKMPFEDPVSFVGSEEETIAKFRKVRDLIEERIKIMIEELTINKGGTNV